MEWLKRATGVKIFVAIWLLIALVPVWRLQAWRQWQSDQLYDGLHNTNSEVVPITLGLTPQNAHRLAQQLPNDAAAQTLTKDEEIGTANSSDYIATIVEQKQRLKKNVKAVFAGYAALSRRFPASNYLRAKWLRDVTRGSFNVESPELMASYHLGDAYSLPPTWISEHQTQEAIQAARDGARLEPSNAFWPWMQAVLLFSLRREEAAIGALERAGKCAYFDDYTDATVRSRIELMHRIQTSNLDDEIGEVAFILFPHLSRLRAAARETMWNAQLAYNRGDKARALEITGILQRAGVAMARTRSSYISLLVGEAIDHIAWHGLFKVAGLPEPKNNYSSEAIYERQKYSHDVAATFATLARRNGRSDLAREAQNIAARLRGPRLGSLLKNRDTETLLEPTERFAHWHWISSWFLRLAAASALLWVVSVLATRKNSDPLSHIRRGSIISAAFCVGITGAVLWAILQIGATQGLTSYLVEDSPSEASRLNETFLPWVLGGIWLFPVVFPIVFSRRFWLQTQHSSSWRSWVPTFFYVSAIGSFLFVFAVLSNPPESSVGSRIWPIPILLSELLVCGATYFVWRRVRPAMRTSAVLWIIALLSWLAWLYLNAYSRDGQVDITYTIVDDKTITLIGGVSLLCVALAISNWLWINSFKKLDSNEDKTRYFPWLKAVQTLIYALFLGGFLALAMTTDPSTTPAFQRFIGMGELCYFIAFLGLNAVQFLKARGRRRLSVCFLLTALWVYLLSLFIYNGPDGNFYGPMMTFLACVCLALGFWFRCQEPFKLRSWQSPFLLELATRIRLAMATLAVCSTLTYFVLLFAIMPARHQAQQLLDRQLQLGEVAFLEEQWAEQSK